MKNKSNFKNELEMTFALQQMEKTAPEIVRFQGLCQAASIRIFIFTRRQYNSFRFHVYDEISFPSDYWFSRHIRTYLQVWAIP